MSLRDALPAPPTPNERVLAAWRRERFVPSAAATTIALAQTPIADTLEVGIVGSGPLDPNGGAAGFAVDGATVTLGTGASGTAVYLVTYYAKAS